MVRKVPTAVAAKVLGKGEDFIRALREGNE